MTTTSLQSLRQPTASQAADTSEARGADAILRRTLRRHASGITVITVPGPAGFTATSFTSVSLDPALVSFCLGATASTAAAVRRAERFAVHLLGAENTDLARQFARSGIDRFEGVRYRQETDGLPVLADAPAWLTARVVSRQRLGDHYLVVGQVESGDVRQEAPALVHHAGEFAAVSRVA
ncbi:flavin reductase family protein [Streptomyces sp. NPDC057694]|uniref:flavin reductase family protein n=1 Tax=Streptomyces sp. NPDC057694 TaxID=3346216 RepID=UPI0036AC8714